jgi:hypothetical protein
MLRHPVPEPVLARIGDITVSFALLESVIQSLVGSLLQQEQRIGQIVTAELSFRNLRALTLSLYRGRHGEGGEYETLSALMQRASDLEDLRNQITHSLWATGGTAETVTRIKMTAKEKRGLHFDFKKVTADDLAEVADEIKRLAFDIQEFWVEGLGLPGPAV